MKQNIDDLSRELEPSEAAEQLELSEQAEEQPAPEQKPQKSQSVGKVVKKLANRWFIDAFTGMAQGLFVTLIAGTILCQMGTWCGGQSNAFGAILLIIGNFAKTLMGAGIGVGIAHKLGAKPLVIFGAAVSGLLGAWSMTLVNVLVHGAAVSTATAVAGGTYGQAMTLLQNNGLSLTLGSPGNPIGAYVVALVAIEIASLYCGKTKVDIVLVPLGMLLLTLVSIWIAWPFVKLVDLIGQGLVAAISAGTAFKIIVGILVAIVLGILLTMPTSSAAIWIAIAATATGASADYQLAMSIAGGAATAGCAAHMIGFAVASFRENKWGGLVSQGIGTSMLQIPNIMRNPRIMIPEIVASAVAGLVAVLLDVRCTAVGGGMGTSGLVGVFGIIDACQAAGVTTWKYVLGIILCMFVIPAVVSFGVSELLRKVGWIKPGDQALQ